MHRRSDTASIMVIATTILLCGTAGGGEWEDEFPITQDLLFQYRSYLTTAPDDTVFVLWPDWSDYEDVKVNLMKSTDHGQTWIGPTIIFEGLAYENMDLHADADGLHLLLVEFWEDEENEYRYLYYSRSVDGGDTFSTPVRVGTQSNIQTIKLFSGGGNIYVYGKDSDYESGGDFNYLYSSGDGGETWQENPLLPGTIVQNPSFTVRDGLIHMVFGGFLVEPEIQHCVSVDGVGWTRPVQVSRGSGAHSQLPQIAIDGQAIHVVWEDDRTGYFEIMYSRSTDGGLSWSRDVRVNWTRYGARAKLLTDEEGLHLVWCQYHGDNGWPTSWGSYDYGIIWYRFSGDAGLTWSAEVRVSQNEAIPPIDLPEQGANVVKLAEYGSGFCAMWQDKRDGNIDLYMRNYVGSAVVGDLDCDGDVDFDDINPFVLALSGEAAYLVQYPDCHWLNADCDGDGDVDFDDINPFVALMGL